MKSTKGMLTLMSVANILIIILAIVIICLSLCNWIDYVICSLTILIALCWICCICVENNVIMSCYTISMIINSLFLLGIAIYHLVNTIEFSQYCYNNKNNFSDIYDFGCHDWRFGLQQRSTSVIVCYFLIFIFRVGTIALSCLLARNIYNNDY